MPRKREGRRGERMGRGRDAIKGRRLKERDKRKGDIWEFNDQEEEK